LKKSPDTGVVSRARESVAKLWQFTNSGAGGSGLKFRAFISQDIGAGAGIQILDAQKDLRANVAPIQAGATPGPMVVTPNRVQTLVFSPADAKLTLISNAGESAGPSLTMPGFTESLWCRRIV